MRLFNLVGLLILAALVSPASASENKSGKAKHKELSKVFAPIEKNSAFDFAELSDRFLTAHRSDKADHQSVISRDESSHGSFQAGSRREHESHEGFSDDGERAHSFLNKSKKHHGEGSGHHGEDWLNDDEEHHSGHWDDHDEHENEHEWDDDDFTQPVPEPETYAMMLMGLLMLGVAMRKQA